jgi:hypothetical protein
VCGHDAFDAGRLCGALEDQDAGSVVVSADADVVQAPVDAQGDGAGLVDAVGADAVAGVGAGAGVCFGSGLVDRGGVGQ